MSIISVDLRRGTASCAAQPASSFTSDFTRQSRSKELILFASTRLVFGSRQRGRTADARRLVPFFPCLCKSSERENQSREVLAGSRGKAPGVASQGRCARSCSPARLPHSRAGVPIRAGVKASTAPAASRTPSPPLPLTMVVIRGCDSGGQRASRGGTSYSRGAGEAPPQPHPRPPPARSVSHPEPGQAGPAAAGLGRGWFPGPCHGALGSPGHPWRAWGRGEPVSAAAEPPRPPACRAHRAVMQLRRHKRPPALPPAPGDVHPSVGTRPGLASAEPPPCARGPRLGPAAGSSGEPGAAGGPQSGEGTGGAAGETSARTPRGGRAGATGGLAGTSARALGGGRGTERGSGGEAAAVPGGH